MKLLPMKLWKIGVLLVVFVFYIFIFLASIQIRNLLLYQNEIITSENDFHSYQYLHRNVLEEETSFGIVTISGKLEPNSFIFKKDQDFISSGTLISNFGEEEYECFGTCACEGDENVQLRRTVSILRQGMIYLLVSLSSFAAYERAKSYFEEECKTELSEYCDSGEYSIQSEVLECKKVSEASSSSTSSEDDDTSKIGETDPFDERKYLCYGNCSPKKISKKAFRTAMIEKLKEIRSSFDCSKLKREGEVVVDEEYFYSKNTPNVMRDYPIQTLALKKFRSELSRFCKLESRKVVKFNFETSYRQKYKNKVKKKNREEKVYEGFVDRKRIWTQSTTYLCKTDFNSVRCRQIDPPPQGRNSEWRSEEFWKKKKVWDES